MARRLAFLPLDELVGDERNPKDHDEATLDASIDRFGYIEPIVRDDRTGRLISGHGRTASLRRRQEVGDEPPEGVDVDRAGRWLVPVLVGWASKDDDEAAAALIALNRVGERGGWDERGLADLLGELAAGPGLAGVGYADREVERLLASLERPTEITYDAAGDPSAAAGAEPSLDDRAANYRHRELRSMVLDYPLAEYHEVLELASAARVALGVDSNAALLLALLDQWQAGQVEGSRHGRGAGKPRGPGRR